MIDLLHLLPCPFCGGEAKIYKGVQLYWGSCMVCHAEGTTKYTETEAIAAWNTRTERVDERKTNNKTGDFVTHDSGAKEVGE